MTVIIVYGHTTLNTPVLVRSPKLSNVWPGQSLDGRLPGNAGCRRLLFWLKCRYEEFKHINTTVISRLQHIQNTAARVVTLNRKSCRITPILKELHWLPVSQRIVFKLMLIVHKSVNNIAPIYISELLKVYTPSRNLRSSNMSLLKEPTSKRTWSDRSFSVAAPILWNHLPTKLKSCHSITRFMSVLKTSSYVTIFQRWCIFVIALYMYLGT